MVHRLRKQTNGSGKAGIHKQTSLFRFRPSWADNQKEDNFYNIENVPAEDVEKIVTGNPNADLESYQNDSPKLRVMLALVKKYGGSLEGYVVPVASGREDARISFDGMKLNVSETTARKLKAKFLSQGHSVDEFDKVGKSWRFWWD